MAKSFHRQGGNMSITETARDLWKLAQAAGNAELVTKTTQAIVEASELAEKNATLIQENSELREQLRTIQAADDLRSRLIPNDAHSLYVLRDGSGGVSGPFCVFCFDDGDKLIHAKLLVSMPAKAGRKAYKAWQCPKCLKEGSTPAE